MLLMLKYVYILCNDGFTKTGVSPVVFYEGGGC
jgi:hypothetical protein